MKLTWLDLCSGLGGASAPALDRGWRVIRVDIERRFKPDTVADIRNLPLSPFPIDVLWASPPCVEFARIAMPWLSHPTGEPDLSISLAVKRIIEQFQPRYFVVENTRHSRKWLTPVFGPVAATIPGHIFWGRLPCLLPIPVRRPKESLWPSENRAAERAKIPYPIGEAICRAVEARTTA